MRTTIFISAALAMAGFTQAMSLPAASEHTELTQLDTGVDLSTGSEIANESESEITA